MHVSRSLEKRWLVVFWRVLSKNAVHLFQIIVLENLRGNIKLVFINASVQLSLCMNLFLLALINQGSSWGFMGLDQRCSVIWFSRCFSAKRGLVSPFICSTIVLSRGVSRLPTPSSRSVSIYTSRRDWLFTNGVRVNRVSRRAIRMEDKHIGLRRDRVDFSVTSLHLIFFLSITSHNL